MGILVTILDIPVTFLFDLLAASTAAGNTERKQAMRLSPGAVTPLSQGGAHAHVPSTRRGTTTGRRVSSTQISVRRASGLPSYSPSQISFSLSPDVLTKRHSVIGQAPQLLGGNIIGNSGFAERRSSVRQTLIGQRSSLTAGSSGGPGVNMLSTGAPGKTASTAGGLASFAMDLSLHLEALRDSDPTACLTLMRQWNYSAIPTTALTLNRVPAMASWEEEAFAYAAAQHEDLRERNTLLLNTELELVQQQAEGIMEGIANSNEDVVGMSILHEFILDVVGREQARGKIFERKTHVDFKKKNVVSYTTKLAAGLLITCINLFCLFYAILKGYSRGVAWQQQFLFAVILQLVVEILIFETVEVLWGNVVMPQFAIKEVNAARVHILTTINKFIEDAQFQQRRRVRRNGPGVDMDVSVFNTVEFFFVSKELARARPGSIESKIVDRFESTAPTPGLLSKFGHTFGEEEEEEGATSSTQHPGFTRLVRGFSYFITLNLIQFSANTPSMVHEILLSILQPLLLGGGGYLVYVCIHHPLFYIGWLGVLALIYAIYRYLTHVSEHQQKNITASAVLSPLDAKFEEFQEVDSSSDSDSDSGSGSGSDPRVESLHGDGGGEDSGSGGEDSGSSAGSERIPDSAGSDSSSGHSIDTHASQKSRSSGSGDIFLFMKSSQGSSNSQQNSSEESSDSMDLADVLRQYEAETKFDHEQKLQQWRNEVMDRAEDLIMQEEYRRELRERAEEEAMWAQYDLVSQKAERERIEHESWAIWALLEGEQAQTAGVDVGAGGRYDFEDEDEEDECVSI